MSKNITIAEGGTPFNFSADELRTDQVGGGHVDWVPKDETRLTTKTITKDGTYKAADEGYYGYSQFTVRGIGKAAGTGPDGREHIYEETEGGGVTDTVLPSSIAVTTPPTFTGPYGDRAYISFDGIGVTAYDATGGVWTGNGQYPNGIIPASELSFPETIADIEKATDSGTAQFPMTGSLTYQTYGVKLVVSRLAVGTVIPGNAEGRSYKVTSAEGKLFAFKTSDSASFYYFIICSPEPFVLESKIGDEIRTTVFSKSRYYGVDCAVSIGLQSLLPLGDPGFVRINPIISDFGVAYHDIGYLSGQVPEGGIQPIPVWWTRPGDGKMLETSFDISVVDITPGGHGDD